MTILSERRFLTVVIRVYDDVNIFQNGVFKIAANAIMKKINNILSLVAKFLEIFRFRENGHGTLKYDHTKWKLN